MTFDVFTHHVHKPKVKKKHLWDSLTIEAERLESCLDEEDF